MSIHTQCLSVLILLYTLSPMSIAQFIFFMTQGERKNLNEEFFLKILVGVYIILIVTVAVVNPAFFYIKRANSIYWYGIAIVAAPLIIILEIIFAYLIMKLEGKEVSGIDILSQWKKTNVKVAISTVVIGISEEIVYRLIWFNILMSVLEINTIFVIIISAFFYALNHIPLGKHVFMQKILSGCVFGILYFLSGGSIIIPIIAHGLQNAIIVLKGGQ